MVGCSTHTKNNNFQKVWLNKNLYVEITKTEYVTGGFLEGSIEFLDHKGFPKSVIYILSVPKEKSADDLMYMATESFKPIEIDFSKNKRFKGIKYITSKEYDVNMISFYEIKNPEIVFQLDLRSNDFNRVLDYLKSI